MNYRSFALLAASLTLIGGGCSKISDRFQSAPPPAATSTAEVAPPDLTGAEYFLRSRDDVAPGQLDVTNQTLFAKTKNGQIVPVIKDVHEALGGELLATSYLVQVKELPQTLRYIYFVNSLEGSSAVAHQLYAFDTETKEFVNLPVTVMSVGSQIADFKFSPDHTKIAIFPSIAEKKDSIYVGDVVTGQIVAMFDINEKQTLTESGTNISGETKWTDNTKFSVALFDRTQKSGEKYKPVDTVVIDTTAILDTSKFENLMYSYASNIDTLFARPLDKQVAVAVLNRVTKNFESKDVDGSVDIFSGVTQNSPFVFFKQTFGMDSQMFIAIFEKRTGKMISTKPLEGKMIDHSVLSKSGKSLALFSMMEYSMNIQLVDLVTLHSFEKSVDLEGLSPDEHISGKLDSEGGSDYGPNKWSDDKTFVFNLYKPVDYTKKADEHGHFSVKQPLAKTIKIKFE